MQKHQSKHIPSDLANVSSLIHAVIVTMQILQTNWLRIKLENISEHK
jgi:hypothetical protein